MIPKKHPPVPPKAIPNPEWAREFRLLILSRPWLKEKLDRTRRLQEQWAYLRELVPELWDGESKGLIIDLGCGPGELLELTRQYGFDVLGVDASAGDGGMGDAWLKAARMLSERNRVPVEVKPFSTWLYSTKLENAARLINSRGSWEQMFSEYMDGPPHHEHHNATKLSWRIDDNLMNCLVGVMIRLTRILQSNGILLIHCNGSSNHQEFEPLLLKAADIAGLSGRGVLRKYKYCYKWIKP